MKTAILSHLMDAKILQSKFRGTFLGVLVGDCCGAPFEDDILEAGDKINLRKYFDKLQGPFFKAPSKPYTDDTAMTISVAKCLIDYKDLPNKELAGNFMREYFRAPKRGYGAAITSVFFKWRQSKLEDPLAPARDQFGGSGSYGNGAAMRVSPVSLFCHNKHDKLTELVKKSIEVTHTHRLAKNGALLQAYAVYSCLHKNPNNFDRNTFLNEMTEKMKELEKDDEGLGLHTDTEYQDQLKEIKRLLDAATNVTEEEVLNKLGHSVAALYSVPTAIYCFLKAQNDIEGIKTDNPFRRTLEYAISLGGDTDTIASMAGSLTGALYGDTIIAENLIKHCESHSEIINTANNLYEASVGK